MNEKFWDVHRGLTFAIIVCPHCEEFFDVPNLPGSVEDYRFCPKCGERVGLREEDEYKYESEYR